MDPLPEGAGGEDGALPCHVPRAARPANQQQRLTSQEIPPLARKALGRGTLACLET
jgi:hypothetical protein